MIIYIGFHCFSKSIDKCLPIICKLFQPDISAEKEKKLNKFNYTTRKEWTSGFFSLITLY